MWWFRDTDHKGTVTVRTWDICKPYFKTRYQRIAYKYGGFICKTTGYLPLYKYGYYRLLAKRKRGIVNERKQTPGIAARTLGTATIFEGKQALEGFTTRVVPGESTKSNCNGLATWTPVPVEKGGET